MLKEINLQNTESLLPPLYYELAKVKEYELGYKYYKVRHPGAIFSTGFTETITSLNSLYNKVNNLQMVADASSDSDREEVISLTKEFLLQLINYFESGYEIFLCFCPPLSKPAAGQELHKWFRNQSFSASVENYFITTDILLKRYRKLLNALKHSSNQLRVFQFINPRDTGSAIGFYLEGVNEAGVIGPVADFHPLSDGQYTAWSYNLHLKNFYFLVYKIALEAELVVKNLCSTNSINLTTSPAPLSTPNLELLAEEAFQNISRLSNPTFVHFPQEGKDVTKIPSISSDSNSLIFSDYTAGNRIVSRGSRAVMSAKGDGFSRSFSLPYFGGEAK